MKDHVVSHHEPYLVLFSNTHVVFLDKDEHGLAEALNNRNVYFQSARIESVTGIPSGVQLGKIYRHCAPTELSRRRRSKSRH